MQSRHHERVNGLVSSAMGYQFDQIHQYGAIDKAKVSPMIKDDHLAFRKQVSKVSRKINFNRNCSKYSRTFLRDDIEEWKRQPSVPDGPPSGYLAKKLLEIKLDNIKERVSQEIDHNLTKREPDEIADEEDFD